MSKGQQRESKAQCKLTAGFGGSVLIGVPGGTRAAFTGVASIAKNAMAESVETILRSSEFITLLVYLDYNS
jgi:hypothetical protein